MLFTLLLCSLASSQSTSFLQQDSLCSRCLDSAGLLAQTFFSQSLQDSEAVAIEDFCGSAIDPYVCRKVGETVGRSGLKALYSRYWKPESLCADAGLCTHSSQIAAELQFQPEIATFPQKERANTNADIRILILSDIHLDLAYEPGSEVYCNQPLCCRPAYTHWPNITLAAGHWGAPAACDLPIWTLEAALDAAKALNPDIILWLGDTSPHDLWNYRPDLQNRDVRMVAEAIREKMEGVSVYPAIGNHECFPSDQFMPGAESGLLESLAEAWSPWLSPESKAQFLQNGFYHARDDSTGLHILSLNTQMADTMNFFIAGLGPDPGNMLEWAEKVLKHIESLGEFAILIGHIPPGDHFTDSSWARLYQRLATRFQTTIKGHFYAHTHNAQFYVIQSDSAPGETAGVIFACPSLTTYTNHDPTVRLVQMHRGNGELTSMRDFAFPLDEANQQGNAWKDTELREIFDAISYYSLSDLSAQSWQALSLSLSSSPQQFSLYWLCFNYGRSPPCDCKSYAAKCAKRSACETQYSVYDDMLGCAQVTSWDLLYLAAERVFGLERQ